MGHYRFQVHVAAKPEKVFDLWMNLDRMHEWIGGLTRVTDGSGPPDHAGARYTVWFGRMGSPTEILEFERPTLVRSRFGNSMLRAETRVTFEADGDGTRLTQEFWTSGLISAVTARIFATGSYQGSFRGELRAFVDIAERESAAPSKP